MDQIESTIKSLKERNINAYSVKNKQEAKDKVLSLLDENMQISFGGSITLNEIGIFEELRKGSYKLIDRDQANDNKYLKHFMMKLGSSQGAYLSGTNALTEDGKIVNVDGWGNRVNAIQYGPDKVIIVVGKNKIVKDLETALKRVETIAAPKNTKRLNKKTPCFKSGKCEDCRSPERICNIISVIQFQNDPNRMHVIIVDEELGY
jgi:L-lactate utilization protein LutB